MERRTMLAGALALAIGVPAVAAQNSDIEAQRKLIREVADSLKAKADATRPAPAPRNWKAARTPWGDPDIAGVYTNSDESGIPFERPAEFEGRRLEDVTGEELARLQRARREAVIENAARLSEQPNPQLFWWETLNATNSRAWLVADPPDGKIPPQTPEAPLRAAARAARRGGRGPADSYEDRSLYDQCISRGLPGSMMPAIYGSSYQIHQGPGVVAIRYEMIHETRVIPLDARAHVGPAIRSYMGDARGHWEGDTLVVETTNFKDQIAYRGSDGRTLKLIERFKPVGPVTVEWSVTVDDPSTWVRPWTFAMHLTRKDQSQQPFEYACHEGNYGLRNILSAARSEDSQRAAHDALPQSVLRSHPDLGKGVVPFADYVSGGSTLSPRHRELLVLRTAWLARSDYQWARHAPVARAAGFTQDEIVRIALGPDERGWDAFEATLLRMADELHVNAFVSDGTWQALTARYSTHQVMDAVFTVAEFEMLSEVVNTLRVPVARDADRLPEEVIRRLRVAKSDERLIGKAARIPALEPAQWTPEVRKMLDPSGAGRPVAGVYRTYAQHPSLYAPRQLLSEYIRLQSTLDARTRELLIMRIGWLCRSEYEWGAHAPAGRRAGMTDADVQHVIDGPRPGSDSADDTLLRAVDELYATSVVSDATWKALSARLNARQLLDVLITTGGYRMVSMSLNTFGVPLEPNGERFPPR